MNIIRCAHLDWLGRQLIEAYRRQEDNQVLLSNAGTGEVRAMHRAIADHSNNCSLCLAKHRKSEIRIAERPVPSRKIGFVMPSRMDRFLDSVTRRIAQTRH
jgi:hypothetical protein